MALRATGPRFTLIGAFGLKLKKQRRNITNPYCHVSTIPDLAAVVLQNDSIGAELQDLDELFLLPEDQTVLDENINYGNENDDDDDEDVSLAVPQPHSRVPLME